MCGIAGLWRLKGGAVNRQSFDRFVDSLAHRGPDGRGVWFDDPAGMALGHRRLAILDCTEDGSQPMGYHDGRYWIVFNGEIYNFLELRRELEEKGFAFHSQSDTEVILAAFVQWGPEMLSRFNGMWAFAIYDRAEKSLFMARDRFGIKPFLYQHDERQFAFASELKAFKRLEGYKPEIDLETAKTLLNEPMAAEGTRQTFFKGVQRLQGGHYAFLRGGRLSVRRWWNTLDHLAAAPADPADRAEQFGALFEDAVKLRMRSDVPVGTCLSGGFDSTSVVCALARLGRQEGHDRQARVWQQTFVATFPGAENDERAEAEKVIQYAGVRGNFLPMDDSFALRGIDRVLGDFDDVYFNLPTNSWMIYQQLRLNNVRVSLDGHGADELMGAYKPAEYLLLSQAPHLLSHPARNLELLRRYFSLLHTSRRPGNLAARFRLGIKMTATHHPDFARLRDWTRSFRRTVRKTKRNPFVRAEPNREDPAFKPVGSDDEMPVEWGPLNRELYTMFHGTVLPTLLRNYDRVSMAHGIEIRMPFMDWRLICFVMSLPDDAKISEGQTKRVARDAMKGLIPEEIRTSKIKMGFGSPLPVWLRGPLRNWVGDVLAEPQGAAGELVDLPALRRFIENRNSNASWTWQESEQAWLNIHYLWFTSRFLKI